MDEFLKSLREQGKFQPEPSYADELEKQKAILLKQREVDNLKELLDGTKVFCEQLEVEDRCLLEQAHKTKALVSQLDELKIKVQSVIDQNFDLTMNKLRENCYRNTALNKQRHQKRQMIVNLKQQHEHYKGLLVQMQESKGQVLLREAQDEYEEEKNKLEAIRSEINSIRKTKTEGDKKYWEEKKAMFVEMAKLQIQIKTQNEQTSAVMKNNELLKTRIIQLSDEIETQKEREEAEAIRRKNELDEQVMTPLKIIHAVKSQHVFKNPNDFPMLVESIQNKRSYESIFKRSEFHNSYTSRRKGENTATHNKTTIPHATFLSKAESTPLKRKKQTVPKNSPDNTTTMYASPSNEFKTQEKLIVSESEKQPKRRPAQVPSQQATKKIDSSESQPKASSFSQDKQIIKTKNPTNELENITKVSESKTNVSEVATTISEKASNSNKPEKQKNQPAQVDGNAVATSVESDPKSNFASEGPTQKVIPSPQKDENQSGSMQTEPGASEDQDYESTKDAGNADTVSLASTISSFDLDEREGSSDLGFDLSPVVARKGKKGSDGSESGDLDFDFLTDSPKQAAAPRKNKKQNDFDFLSADNDNSFDFF
ncbi:uncharacterized protein LOC129768284 [Toxorhynchites rutilus septentrionalis]|uniref:uncharacterized protein LOC129768284 n=1 Tax=Toxorhynchites rutilus septentrionalis TaxID=329112 RepID=UPI002479C08B|nr:uncharacterized protein LOC129768284 [Toxorhynchites rutilus septentrionalis]